MKTLFFLLLNVSLLLAKSYEVDVANSSVEFKVRHMLFTTTQGTFEKFSGQYTMDENTKKLLSLEGEVVISSLSTKDSNRDEFLLSEKFFDKNKYPNMTLKLLENGIAKLTIKDVSKDVPFKIGFADKGFIMMGEISRKTFGLNFGALAETGGIAVGDSVKISLKIIGSEKGR